MEIDDVLQAQLDEAVERGTTEAELDLIVEEYEETKKKKDSPQSSGASNLKLEDTPLSSATSPQTEEVEVETESIIDPEPEPSDSLNVARPSLSPDFFDVKQQGLDNKLQMDQGARDAQIFKNINSVPQDLRSKILGSLENEEEEDEDRSLFSRSLFALTESRPEDLTEVDQYAISNPEAQQSILNERLSESFGGVTTALKEGIFAPSARGGATMLGMGLKSLKLLEAIADGDQFPTEEIERISRETKARRDKITELYGYDHKGKDPLATFGFGKDNDFDGQGSAVYVGEAIFETFPLIVASAYNRMASIPLLFAYGTSMAQDESIGQGWYEDLTPVGKLGYTSAFGALEAIPEWAGGRILSRAVKKYAAGKMSEQVFKKLTRDYAIGAAKGIGIDMGTNAGTEGVTGFGQELLNQYARGEPTDVKAALREMGNGVLLGGPAGFVYGLPGSVADINAIKNGMGRNFSNYRAKKDIERLHRRLEDPTLTSNQKIIYTAELREAIERRTKLSVESQQLLERIGMDNPETLNKVAELDQRQQSVMIKAANNMKDGKPIDKKLHEKYGNELTRLDAQYIDLTAPYVLQETGAAIEAKERQKYNAADGSPINVEMEGLTPDEFIEDSNTYEDFDTGEDARELGEAAKAAEAVFGGRIKMILHNEYTDSYARTISNLDPNTPVGKTEGGRLIKNPNTGKAEIHINAENATRADIAHETFHGVFYEQFAQDKEIADRMAAALKKSMNNSSSNDIALVKNVEDLIAAYDESVKPEEFLATISGELTSTYTQLSRTGKTKFTNALVSFIDDVLKSLGITGLSNFRQNLNSEKEVIDFLNKFNRAFNQGIEFGITETQTEQAPVETRQKETLRPDATPDDLANFEKDTPARKARAKKEAAEKKRKLKETQQREKAEDEIQKQEDINDAKRLQREDDIRSGKIENVIEAEESLLDEINGATATLETRQAQKSAEPRKTIKIKAETEFVKRSKGWMDLIQRDPSDFAGETIITTPSDRMAVARYNFKDGTSIDLKGGFGYAQEVGLPWASAKEAGINKFAIPVNKQIKEKGYAYLAPVAMSDASHASNFQFLLTGLGEIRSAIKTGSATEADVRAKLEQISGMRIGKEKDVKDGKGNILEVGKDVFLNDLSSALAEKDINKVLKKLEDVFRVGNATFPARKALMSKLIGDTQTKAKNPVVQIKGVLTGAELVKRTTDPALIDMPRGYIPGLIKITELIEPYQTSEKADGFQFHESYPWTAKTASGKGVEFIPFTKAISMTELEGGTVNFDDIVKQGKNINDFFASMGMANAPTSEVTTLPAQETQTLKDNIEREKTLETRQALKQKRFEEVEGPIRGKASARNVFNDFREVFLTDFLESFQTNFVDKYYSVVKFQKEFQKRTGRKYVDLDQDIINALTLGDSASANALEAFKKQRDELGKLMRKAGLSAESLGNLLMHLHVPERNARKTPEFEGENFSGISNERALEIISQYDLTLEDLKKTGGVEEALIANGRKDVWNVLELTYQILEDNRTDMIDSGLLTGGKRQTQTRDGKKYYQIVDPTDSSKIIKEFTETKARTNKEALKARDLEWNKLTAWSRGFKYYVPLKGFAPVESELAIDSDITEEYVHVSRRPRNKQKSSSKSQEVKDNMVKRAKGRLSEADNPLIQLLSDRAHVIIKAQKNRSMNRLYNLVTDPNNKKSMEGYAKSLGGYSQQKFGSLDDIDLRPELITLFVKGKRTVMEFDDPRVVAALDGSNMSNLHNYTKGLGALNRLMSSTITMLDPEFVLRNFTRDLQTGLANLQGEENQIIMEMGKGDINKGVARVMKNLIPAFRAIRTQEVTSRGVLNVFKGFSRKKRAEATARQEAVSKYYDEFKETGAKTDWFYAPTPEEIAKDLAKAVPNGNKPSKVAAGATKVADAAQGMLKVISGYNTSVENAIRLSAYVTARESGVSAEKAAELAKNLTVNFNRSGAYGSLFNSLYLFFNASIQGSSTILRVLDPRSKYNTPRKIAYSMSLFGAMTTVLNQLLWSDEEEDGRTVYEKLPDWEKKTNAIIVAGDKVFKTPIGYGYNAFYYAGVAAAETALGVQKPGQALGNLMGAAVGAFSPLNFPTSASNANFIVKTIAPTGLLPFVNLQLNEDYYGQAIYPEENPFSDVPQVKSSSDNKKTTEMSKALARGINLATFGKKDVPGRLDIPPESIDYLAGYYLAGLGKTVQRTENVAKSTVKAISETEAADPFTYIENFAENTGLSPKEIPFVRVFVSSRNQFEDYAKFRELETKVETLHDRYAKDAKTKIKSIEDGNDKLMVDAVAAKKLLDILTNKADNFTATIKKIKKLQEGTSNTKRLDDYEETLNELYDARSSLQLEFNKSMIKKTKEGNYPFKELLDSY